MKDHLINQWHCDDSDCNKIFYADLEEQPVCCPFCHSIEISDSKILEAKPFSLR